MVQRLERDRRSRLHCVSRGHVTHGLFPNLERPRRQGGLRAGARPAGELAKEFGGGLGVSRRVGSCAQRSVARGGRMGAVMFSFALQGGVFGFRPQHGGRVGGGGTVSG